MKIRNIKQNLFAYEQIMLIAYLVKWSFFALLVGILSGSASALFLNTLQWATNWRNMHDWIIAFLPIGGFVIGALYYYYGQSVVKGNNQLLDEFQDPKRIIPFRMAPLVFFGTIATHFFGGSAGREGTGVQIGGAIADQLTRVFKLNIHDRRILIVCGISGGFASVFGTPLAGAIFALEVLVVGRMRYEAIVASFLTALIANISCNWWGVDHTHYEIPFVPSLTLEFVGWSILAGIAFGLTAMLFSKMSHQIGKLSVATIKYPPLRPVVGGALLALVVYL
ncbi:MAG: chloride channel protein, partial [Tannerellaceae bacterium]